VTWVGAVALVLVIAAALGGPYSATGALFGTLVGFPPKRADPLC
jgi:hypothetical protein